MGKFLLANSSDSILELSKFHIESSPPHLFPITKAFSLLLDSQTWFAAMKLLTFDLGKLSYCEVPLACPPSLFNNIANEQYPEIATHDTISWPYARSASPMAQ